MEKVEVRKSYLTDLEAKSFECNKLRKRFIHLDKGTQEMLLKIERYEEALGTLTWQFGCVSPESMRMREIAKRALYNEK